MVQADDNIVSLVRQILVAYQNSILVTSTLIDGTHEVLDECERELERSSHRLRETLAQRASLRRKDFDSIVGSIESRQRERHQQVKRGLNEFIHSHEVAVCQMKRLLDTPGSGETADLRAALDDIKMQEGVARSNLTRLLQDFQGEHEGIIVEIRRLLSGNGAVKTKDVKAAFGRFAVKGMANAL